eukprot:g44823.t1
MVFDLVLAHFIYTIPAEGCGSNDLCKKVQAGEVCTQIATGSNYTCSSKVKDMFVGDPNTSKPPKKQQ